TITVAVGNEAYPSVTNIGVLSYAGDTDSRNNTAPEVTVVRKSFNNRIPTDTATAAATVGVSRTRTPTATPTRTSTPSAPTATATFGNPTATDLALTKTVGGAFVVSRRATYLLMVTNIGAATTNVPITITDDLPNGLSFVSGTGDGWACSAAGQQVV